MDKTYYEHPNIMRISATFSTLNPKFLKNLIVLNCILTSISLLAFAFYLRNYTKTPINSRLF